MSPAITYCILGCSIVAIAAESVSLLFPKKVLAIVAAPGEGVPGGPLYRALGIMSLVYMVDIALLLFSGDPVFRVYAVILVGTALLLWLFKKHLVSRHHVLMLESGVCLTILIDVVRTILKMNGWIAA